MFGESKSLRSGGCLCQILLVPLKLEMQPPRRERCSKKELKRLTALSLPFPSLPSPLFMALIAAAAAVNWLWFSASKVEVHAAAAAAELDNSAAVSCWKYVIRPLFVERHRGSERRGRRLSIPHITRALTPPLSPSGLAPPFDKCCNSPKSVFVGWLGTKKEARRRGGRRNAPQGDDRQ